MTGTEKASLIPRIIKEEQFEKKEYIKRSSGKITLFSDSVSLNKHIPILKYSAGYETLMNTFVEEIVIADVSGVQIDIDDKGEPCTTQFEDVIIGYVTTPRGEHFLLEPEMRDFLLTDKPELIITSQGVIVGCSKNVMYTSLDGLDWLTTILYSDNAAEIEEILAIEYDAENDIEIITVRHTDGNISKCGMAFDFNFNYENQYNIVLGINRED